MTTPVFVADREAAERMDVVAQLRARGFDARAGSEFATAGPQVAAEIGDARAVCSALSQVTGAAMDAAPELELVVKSGIGVDNIDVDGARERGLPVLRAGGVNSDGPAEWVIGAAIAHFRRFAELDPAVRRGEWARAASRLFRTAAGVERADAGDRRARLDRRQAGEARPCPRDGRDRL